MYCIYLRTLSYVVSNQWLEITQCPFLSNYLRIPVIASDCALHYWNESLWYKWPGILGYWLLYIQINIEVVGYVNN